MEFDELLITTGVDALVRLVREKQKVELKVAASLLSISDTTIEDWAHILEEEGIIKIEYYLTKIYLSWVAPTEEKIKMEKESFYQEKINVEKEIENLKSRLEPDIESLNQLRQSFSKFYADFGPKLEKIEKELGSMDLTAAGASSGAASFEKQEAAISNVDDRLFTLEDSLKVLRKDLENIKLEISGDGAKKSFERLHEDVSSIADELDSISKKAVDYQEQVPSELPAVSEIKKKFDSIKKDFDNIKNANMHMRDDLLSIQESSGVLKEVESSIKKYESKMGETKDELQSLSDAAERLKAESIELAGKIKNDVETLEHFADSIEVAKGILHRFPSQDEIEKELDRIKKVEDSINDKITIISDLLTGLPNIKNLSQEFAQIREKAEEKKTELEAKSEELKTTLEEGASTYSTFEKIKERTLLSIQTYNAQLQSVADEINKLKKQNQEAATGLEQAVKSYQEKLKKQEVGDLVKLAEDLKNKKALMDKIDSSFESISETSENLSRKLNILAKEANLLDLRAGSVASLAPSSSVTSKEM